MFRKSWFRWMVRIWPSVFLAHLDALARGVSKNITFVQVVELPKPKLCSRIGLSHQ